jgi:hypothetical protein
VRHSEAFFLIVGLVGKGKVILVVLISFSLCFEPENAYNECIRFS